MRLGAKRRHLCMGFGWHSHFGPHYSQIGFEPMACTPLCSLPTREGKRPQHVIGSDFPPDPPLWVPRRESSSSWPKRCSEHLRRRCRPCALSGPKPVPPRTMSRRSSSIGISAASRQTRRHGGGGGAEGVLQEGSTCSLDFTGFWVGWPF